MQELQTPFEASEQGDFTEIQTTQYPHNMAMSNMLRHIQSNQLRGKILITVSGK